MSVGTCQGCGRVTNSAVSNWIDSRERNPEKPMECYAAYVDGVWVKGCAYHKAIWFMKSFVDKLLGKTMQEVRSEKETHIPDGQVVDMRKAEGEG